MQIFFCFSIDSTGKEFFPPLFLWVNSCVPNNRKQNISYLQYFFENPIKIPRSEEAPKKSYNLRQESTFGVFHKTTTGLLPACAWRKYRCLIASYSVSILEIKAIKFHEWKITRVKPIPKINKHSTHAIKENQHYVKSSKKIPVKKNIM